MANNTAIQLRNDTAANWTADNPVLAQGEMGLETDTNRIKFGNGTTAWNSLSYVGAGAAFKYGYYTMSANQTTNLANGNPIKFDTLDSGSLPAPSGYQITLPAGKVYKIECAVYATFSTVSAYTYYNIQNLTDSTAVGKYAFVCSVASSGNRNSIQPIAKGILDATAEEKTIQISISNPLDLSTIQNSEAYLLIEEYGGY